MSKQRLLAHIYTASTSIRQRTSPKVFIEIDYDPAVIAMQIQSFVESTLSEVKAALWREVACNAKHEQGALQVHICIKSDESKVSYILTAKNDGLQNLDDHIFDVTARFSDTLKLHLYQSILSDKRFRSLPICGNNDLNEGRQRL